ncbi:hypothetical protein FJY90_00445 [Candidatus Gottesmanbacteria bacterium]|nr:hypothetical protein [Candidatus Gottesmanbacteria bacterium]
MNEILRRVDFEQAVKSNRWIEAAGNLIVFPQDALIEPCSEVLDGFDARKLERPPTADEIDYYKSVIVIDGGIPKEDEDLRVQSLWLGNGPWANVGIVFPDLRSNLTHFQTLQGVLYPKRVDFPKDLRANSQGEIESWLQALATRRVICLTHLLPDRRRAHTLEQLIRPDSLTHRLGIWGIGDIGRNVAVAIRSQDIADSGVSTLLIGGSRDDENVDALYEELQQINIEGIHQPEVRTVKKGEEDRYFKECDLILILVAANIPSPETGSNIDVRAIQYQDNLELLRQFIANAPIKFDGQILIGTDPIEQLIWAIYKEAKKRGLGWNTHQFAGFGGMINRSRALKEAYELGVGHLFIKSGRTFGPHGKMALAFHTHTAKHYNIRAAEELSRATAMANYVIRAKGEKPFFGPAALVAQGIRQMRYPNEGRKSGVLYASPFLPADQPNEFGAFFGCRVRFLPGASAFTPSVEQPYLQQIMDILIRCHRFVRVTSLIPGALQVDPYDFVGPDEHIAFHPHGMKEWEEKATK